MGTDMPSPSTDYEVRSAERHTASQYARFSQLPPARLAGEHPTLVRVRRYIDQNLGSATLSPVTICRDVGVSRSQLYRLFAESDGVSRYILTCRLLKAHAALLSSAERVSNVAFAFGFSSHAHFSRVFKRHFGYAPGTALIHGTTP